MLGLTYGKHLAGYRAYRLHVVALELVGWGRLVGFQRF